MVAAQCRTDTALTFCCSGGGPRQPCWSSGLAPVESSLFPLPPLSPSLTGLPGCKFIAEKVFQQYHVACVLSLLFLLLQFKCYVHRDRKDCQGRGARDGHLDFHTAPELWTVSIVYRQCPFNLQFPIKVSCLVHVCQKCLGECVCLCAWRQVVNLRLIKTEPDAVVVFHLYALHSRSDQHTRVLMICSL